MGVLDKFLNAMKLNDDGFDDDEFLDDEVDDYEESRPKKRFFKKLDDDIGDFLVGHGFMGSRGLFQCFNPQIIFPFQKSKKDLFFALKIIVNGSPGKGGFLSDFL